MLWLLNGNYLNFDESKSYEKLEFDMLFVPEAITAVCENIVISNSTPVTVIRSETTGGISWHWTT